MSHKTSGGQTGALGLDYFEGRKTSPALRYRLERRTREIVDAIRAHHPLAPQSILDLGTADARMLASFLDAFPGAQCTGIEYSPELVAEARRAFPALRIVQGDIQDLGELDDMSIDVVTAAAVIEHVPSPNKVFYEVYRVLQNGGLFILTAPDPLWEHVATLVGHLDDEQHNEVMGLARLAQVARHNGFLVVEARKFMFSPVGFPFEKRIEGVLRSLHLNVLMANQLLVARK